MLGLIPRLFCARQPRADREGRESKRTISLQREADVCRKRAQDSSMSSGQRFNHIAPRAVKRAGITDGIGLNPRSIARQSKTILAGSCKAGRQVEATLWFNRQGQAHIVSTALRLRTWFSIDPQPASISPTINISIVFICAFPVDCGRIVCHPAIKSDSSAILRFFEVAIVLERFDHVARSIVNANHRSM